MLGVTHSAHHLLFLEVNRKVSSAWSQTVRKRSGILLSGRKKKSFHFIEKDSIGTSNSAKYKLKTAPKGQYGTGTTIHDSWKAVVLKIFIRTHVGNGAGGGGVGGWAVLGAGFSQMPPTCKWLFPTYLKALHMHRYNAPPPPPLPPPTARDTHMESDLKRNRCVWLLLKVRCLLCWRESTHFLRGSPEEWDGILI